MAQIELLELSGMLEAPRKGKLNIEGVRAQFMSKEERCEMDKEANFYAEEMLREKMLSKKMQDKAVSDNNGKFVRYKYESKL